MPTSDQDTEITLGTGKMLLLFFGLVLVCAFFFAIGFSFGKKAAQRRASTEPLGSCTALGSAHVRKRTGTIANAKGRGKDERSCT